MDEAVISVDGKTEVSIDFNRWILIVYGISMVLLITIILMLWNGLSKLSKEVQLASENIISLNSTDQALNTALDEQKELIEAQDNIIRDMGDQYDYLVDDIESVGNRVAFLETAREYSIVPGILTKTIGVAWFEGHKETYYNLPMSLVVSTAKQRIEGLEDASEWVREDGCKMLGDYIMVAACYDVHPYGSKVMTSLGEGIVVDTGGFIYSNAQQIDIATNW